IGICIWRSFEWVPADSFDARRDQAEQVLAHARRLSGLLGRVGHATPRDGGWERSCRALAREAGELLERYENAPMPPRARV
ncbi:MAG: hypothetical protein KGL16_01215, partial [Acidobacteriota bacterium]|nr:hypothetical protein [Acidobacteriota bacterium]